MKFIFDFDDVLFNTSKHRGHPLFKEYQFSVIEKAGISMEAILEYYEKERLNQISLKKMLQHFSLDMGLYDVVLDQSKNFINTEMLDLVQKLGKSNCIIVTYGDTEFQLDKIKRSGIESMFSGVIAVSGSKKESIENFCEENKYEKIFFIDDSDKHFKELDLIKYPNLKTVHYTGQHLDLGSFT